MTRPCRGPGKPTHKKACPRIGDCALSPSIKTWEKLPNRCSRQNVINRPLERGLFVAGERWNTCRSSSHLDFLTDQDPGLEWRPRGRSPRCALLRGDSWAHEVRWMFCPGHEPMLGYSQHHKFWVLPFGLSTAPREFTKTLVPVIQLLRSQGIQVHAYLDDWIIRATSREQSLKHTQHITQLLQSLGWTNQCYNPPESWTSWVYIST